MYLRILSLFFSATKSPRSVASGPGVSPVLPPRRRQHRSLARKAWDESESSADDDDLVGDIVPMVDQVQQSLGHIHQRAVSIANADVIVEAFRESGVKDNGIQCDSEDEAPPLIPGYCFGTKGKNRGPKLAANVELQKRRCKRLTEDVDVLAQELRKLQSSPLDASLLWARGDELSD
eukprot:TRINITY_DN60240_c0_g1_i1.p1 TRINITY_DN60240_c0_g1~~TRINITY_DN60240_c0_g1_i1.p1  ORF type:complete len:177 (-),score=21.25 TRINITY_DN60240_c0_g1_i1:36-566(-)